jgi:hypothetical protein
MPAAVFVFGDAGEPGRRGYLGVVVLAGDRPPATPSSTPS